MSVSIVTRLYEIVTAGLDSILKKSTRFLVTCKPFWDQMGSPQFPFMTTTMRSVGGFRIYTSP